jgi:hypothetical protein
MRLGSSPAWIRRPILCVMTRVLPEPAPASTRQGPCMKLTASCWARFRPVGALGGEEDIERGGWQPGNTVGEGQQSYRRRVARRLQGERGAKYPRKFTGGQYNETLMSTQGEFCMILPKFFALSGLLVGCLISFGARAVQTTAFDCGTKPIRLAYYTMTMATSTLTKGAALTRMWSMSSSAAPAASLTPR